MPLSTLFDKPFLPSFALAAACALPSPWAAAAVPEGAVWDTQAQAFITQEVALQRMAQSRYVLLGEKHDSAIHHQLQLQVLQSLQARGRHPALAMEQLDSEHQPALDTAATLAALPPEAAAERLADLGQLNRKGWRWPMYRELLAFAAAQHWKVFGANLSRSDARNIAMGTVTVDLPALPATHLAAMAAELIDGHCGQALEPQRLQRLVQAQRARDFTMAQTLKKTGDDGAVLIAGAGHVRRNRAVPAYLGPDAGASGTLSVAFTEIDPAKAAPQDYDRDGFDLLWFTATTQRDDPCAEPLALPLTPAPK